LITAEEAGTMSDDAALRLIFAAGLSTSAIISDLSGRGVGMDVVRRNIEAMQGQVDVESTLGVGTGITLTLPLTLATTQQLLVQVDEQIFGIPLAAVERILRIEQKQIGSMQGRPAIVVDNQPIALVYLSDVLEQPRSEGKMSEDGKLPVVVLQSAKTPTAFLVDGVVGQKETVVKSLGKQLGRVRNISGATVLGNGRVILTLNPTDLMKSTRPTESKPSAAMQTASEKTAKKAKHANVLVVDDSLTTRTLEKNILESAGCKVTLAADGQEALNLLHANSGYDVIVSDVIMPRMTGFELTKAIKGDAGLKKIPVVLVTSLGSREDKERGIQAGADAYVVKSNFDQANFLQTIQQLI
jgi:two-component system chemotaxis sensor kinase CheA